MNIDINQVITELTEKMHSNLVMVDLLRKALFSIGEENEKLKKENEKLKAAQKENT
ncbi:MAG: hypothetical protein KC517_09140 [Bacteroidetes bacterium]|nr:hypothetical protein [Bacteroidota bacterium]